MKTRKTFAEKAYKQTQLDASYTQERINTMLEELGISQVRITRLGSNYMVEFVVNMYKNEAPRKVRINVPIDGDYGDNERQKNSIFRVLYYNLKNRFVSVQNGLKEFEEEFLADLVVMVDGEEKRVGDIIAPRYKEMLKANQAPVFHITSGN